MRKDVHHIWASKPRNLFIIFQILEVMHNPTDGVESTSLTDSTASREEEERHHRLTSENDELKKQIAEVR